MDNEELLKLVREFQEKPSDAVRNSIIEELYADVFDMAKEQAQKLPENYEISDLFNAAIIALLENLENVNAGNAEELQHDIFNIVENAMQNELALAIGPPSQSFIDHEDAVKLQQEYIENLKKLHKGDDNAQEEGKQEQK